MPATSSTIDTPATDQPSRDRPVSERSGSERPGEAAPSVGDPTSGSAGTSTRRTLLAATGAGLVAAACAPAPVNTSAPPAPPPPPPVTSPPPPPVTTPPPPAPPQTPVAAARHLAGRATFGATAATVERIRSIGAAAWIDEQLDPGGLDDAEQMVSGYATLGNTNAQNDQIRRDDEKRIFGELDHATLLRAVHSERQLYEVMCDFWTNHLNIWRRAKWLSQLKTLDNEAVVRPHALGKFTDLLAASAKSPAMLVYLDNYDSQGQPGKQVNENYGRELLELHALGIIDGAQVYGEDDVLGVAKVLSGRTIEWSNGPAKYGYRFNPWIHSRDAVSILGGAWSRPSRANDADRAANAESDGDSLIAFLARHPSTARYVCWKLVRRFVADDPPMGLVDRLAGVYSANDTAVVPVLRELFRSPEFLAAAGAKVKRPADWLVSSLRVTGAQIDTDPVGNSSKRLQSTASTLGQALFERPSPDGYPETAPAWVSADGLLKRWEYSARLSRNNITNQNESGPLVVDVAPLLPTPLPATAGALLGALASNACQFDLPATDADAICAALRIAPTDPATLLAQDDTLVRNALGLLLSHPAFQRR